MDSSNLPDGVIISPDTQRPRRLPPNQSVTKKWPVLDASGAPPIEIKEWQFTIRGLVEREIAWSWDEFQKLPRVKVYGDFHCVTRWSKLGNLWEGVATREVLKHAGALPDAKFVLAHAWDFGWSANMPLEDFLADDALSRPAGPAIGSGRDTTCTATPGAKSGIVGSIRSTL